ncbi:MAG: hypothetical protein K2K04_07040 [Clostridia bacterium]|nr:hypothetical protein [Clostridia bacterium]
MKKKSLPTVITVVAAILAVALAVWGGYVFCTQVTIADAQLYALIPIYVISIVLGAFIDELVHEGAHFLVGAILSMGVKVPKIRIFKSSSVEMFPKGVKAMRLRFILTAAAGLFFDLLIIALGIIALTVPTVPAFFALGLPYAFYSFVINVVPLEYGAGKTDGLAVLEAIRNDDSTKVMFAILKVQGMVNGGKLLREVPESMLLDVPQIQEDDINFIMLTQLRCEYYEAIGNDSEAYKYFLRYKDIVRYLPDDTTGRQNKRAVIEAEEQEPDEKETPEISVAEQLEQLAAQSAEEQPAQVAEEVAEATGEKPAEQPEETLEQPAEPEQTEEKKPKRKKKKSE